jgi:hypothetical protein
MPNKLKAGTLRVSYVENQAINRAISILATVKGVTISSLIREATEQYLTREDPKGAILKAAKELVAGQSESVDQRVTEPVDPEVIAKLTALIKKLVQAESCTLPSSIKRSRLAVKFSTSSKSFC